MIVPETKAVTPSSLLQGDELSGMTLVLSRSPHQHEGTLACFCEDSKKKRYFLILCAVILSQYEIPYGL